MRKLLSHKHLQKLSVPGIADVYWMDYTVSLQDKLDGEKYHDTFDYD